MAVLGGLLFFEMESALTTTRNLHINDRVRAVSFALDTGLRMWPVDPANGRWRVVQVDGREPDAYRELFSGDQRDCLAKYPDVAYGINDNETVPPGTLGTVELVDSSNTFVKWDSGHRLGLSPNDVVELIDREHGPRIVKLSDITEHGGRLDAGHYIANAVGVPLGPARVERRTFEAKQHPKGSAERARLNEHALTSEYMTSYRYAAFKPQEGLSERSCWQSFRTRGEAVYWIEN